MSYHTGQQQTNQTDIQTEQTVQQTVTTVTPTVVDPTTEPLELTQLPMEGEQATALETEVNYLPENEIVKNSLSWLEKFGDKDVDLYSDWLIVSKFNIVNNLSDDCLSTDNNELGKIQILKAKGQKCDRCWHYQKETFSGCLLYTSPSPRDGRISRMPSSA